MKQPIPESILHQHIAFLGKTGSGKTSTAKLAVEQIIRSDPSARVCVLDPIKSDWWGLTSSADGKRPGLPFHILGGPRGHVPLHDTAGKVIGELVATGALPLSIIDMADFNAGGLQKFFNDFAPALMKKMRGVIYLVIEEAHEFAPKERSGIGAESMAIHFAKKLATAGRSKGIRMMVLTQRTQALHNALLGSCDTMIAHRLTAPADQEPVKKWLKANVDKEIFEKVSASMSSLKTGSGWICSGEAQVADLIQFPKISTYDNSATPTGNSGDHEVKTAPVDAEKLRTIIGDAVKQAEADDPKKLRAEIVRLTALTKAPQNIPQNIPADQQAIENAEKRGHERGVREASISSNRELAQFQSAWDRFAPALEAIGVSYRALVDANENRVGIHLANFKPSGLPSVRPTASNPDKPRGSVPTPAASGGGDFNSPQRRILDSLAFWRTVGHETPRREQVAAVAGYSPGSGNFNNLLGGLKALGAIDYPMSGAVSLVVEYQTGLDVDAARRMLNKILTGPQQKILEALRSQGGHATREQIAEASGYSAGSGNFNNLLGQLRTLCVIDYPRTGEAEITDWAAQVMG